jgi:large subunit ribosomal protein L4e
MEIDILNSNNEKVGKKKIPAQFNEEIRPDLIKRAVLVIQSHKKQSYGSSPEAGQRASAELSRRRKKYRGSYGHGISRVPRKIMSRSGTRMNWVGAVAPGTVGGRKAHPPKSDKIWWKKINRKERKKAIRSAMTVTLLKEMVSKRGHMVPKEYPFIIDSKFESLSKTKEVIDALEKLGLKEELSRISKKKVRSGKGKSRGRKYNKKKGPLIVISKECKLIKAINNIPGFDIVKVENLNAELLAPGASMGRLTLWSEAAINRLEKEELFLK